MRKTKKLNIVLLATLLVTLLTITTCYADTKSKTSVVYNTKDLGLNTMNKDGSIYIPIRAFSENLHYQVTWDSAKQTVRIYNSLSDIYLNMNGDVKVNEVESKSEKVPVLVNGSVYVPLRFVSENLGIDVNYDAKNSVVTMTGRDIYEISQKDPHKPYLIAYTKDGRKQVGLVSEKEHYNNETSISHVERTKYSDIVSTWYVYSGGLTLTYENQMYVKNGKMIENSKRDTYIDRLTSGEVIGTKYYDDRVALLIFDDDNSYIKVYNDVTGELINKIDTKALYKEGNNYNGYGLDEDMYGKTYNIQAVGKDFIVVSMFQPFEYAKDKEEDWWTVYYYTTVINLETSKIYPVYKNLNYFKECERVNGMESSIGILGDTDSMRGLTESYRLTPSDGVYFDGIQKDDSLRFFGYYYTNPYTSNSVQKHEWCSVDYKN